MIFFSKIKNFIKQFNEIQRNKLAQGYELEEKELRHIFALLVLGQFVGIPSAPTHLTTELLPEMTDELNYMLQKINSTHDPLAELFSVLDVT
jgi:hypothetical protein